MRSGLSLRAGALAALAPWYTSSSRAGRAPARPAGSTRFKTVPGRWSDPGNCQLGYEAETLQWALGLEHEPPQWVWPPSRLHRSAPQVWFPWDTRHCRGWIRQCYPFEGSRIDHRGRRQPLDGL